jgi:membrane associated rhomboid family serine protease
MIVPIGDQPNPRGTPWVNYALLAANVAVFLFVSLPLTGRPPDLEDEATIAYLRELLQTNPHLPTRALVQQALQHLSAYDVFVREWGYVASRPTLVTVVTSMFLHGGWLHLIGNMLFLWIYGDNVEHRLGSLGYLAAYLATGVVAAVGYGSIVAGPAANVPMVGASGAISGVLGFYFVWFPRNKVRLLVLLFPFFVDVVTVGARLVLGFYLVIENVLPFLLQPAQTGGGVAYGAHIGGFVGGLAAAWGLDRLARRRGDQRVRQAAGQRDTSDDDPAAPRSTDGGRPADGVRDAFASGRPAASLQRYFALPPSERRHVPVEVISELAGGLVRDRQPDAALALYRAALLDHGNGPDRDLLLLGLGLTMLYGKGRPTAAYPYLLDALDADPSPEVERAARDALAEIERRQKLRVEARRRW